MLYLGRTTGLASLWGNMDFCNIPPTRYNYNPSHYNPRKSQVYTGCSVYWLQLCCPNLCLEPLLLPQMTLVRPFLTILFAAFSKDSTFISFPRLSDVLCLIWFAQFFFFIFNKLAVSESFLKMVVSLVIFNITLTSFFNSGSSLFEELIFPLFSQCLSFDQTNNGPENYVQIFFKFRTFNPLDESSARLLWEDI